MLFGIWWLFQSDRFVQLIVLFSWRVLLTFDLLHWHWSSDFMVWSVRFSGFPGLVIHTIELFCKLYLQNKSAFLCGVMKTYRQREKQGSKVQESTKGPDEAKIKVTLRVTIYSLLADILFVHSLNLNFKNINTTWISVFTLGFEEMNG